MNKKVVFLLLGIVLLTLSLSAQSNDKTAGSTSLFFWTILIGSASLCITAIVGILSQSKAFCKASENIARNPASADSIRTLLIISLALMESLVIYVLLIDLILFFVKWGNYTVK
jgi:F-type H+-transporting ATPase subunit c